MDFKRELLVFLSSLDFENENIKAAYEKLEDLENFFEVDSESLEQILEGLGGFAKNRIIKYRSRQRVEKVLEICQKQNIQIITSLDDYFFDNLRMIENSPMLVYVKGEDLEITRGISIVGSRKPTAYGQMVVKSIIEGVVSLEPTIISGMAYGIDALAHENALENGLRTICVLGCGVDIIYPKRNKTIYERVLSSGGLIISEYPPKVEPRPHKFPLRNRIISALGEATIVVEAAEKSGSLITATYAASQGKEVFAVPGNINSINSKGCNKLIRDGASIYTSCEDLLEALPFKNKNKVNKEKVSLDMDQTLVYDLISKGISKFDDILEKTKYPTKRLNEIITILEMEDLIYASSFNEYEIVR
ncbi:DNA-processing protein DprA [Peptoniphilus sp. GNH]|nr:DNA-processing protein DprA [Peptoniphilus sp. GNH]